MCDMKIGSVAIVAADPLIASRGVMLHGLLPLLKLVFFVFCFLSCKVVLLVLLLLNLLLQNGNLTGRSIAKVEFASELRLLVPLLLVEAR